jgi:prepilin-type N-terminal cleavage/methylation domain-containing protein
MRSRRGYTLFEVVLVMAIMLIIAALASPLMFEGLYGTTKVTAAADMVRAHWADCGHQAVEHGRPYRFAVIPNTGRFKIEPYDPAHHQPAPDGSGADQGGQNNITPFIDSNTPVLDDSAKTGIIIEDQLPSGVRFGTKDNPVNPDSEESADGDYVTIAVFLPDGTAMNDVEIIFSAKGGTSITLKLRGLTGTCTQFRTGEDGR